MMRRLLPRIGSRRVAALEEQLAEQRRLIGELDARLRDFHDEHQPARLLVTLFHTLAYVSEALPLEQFGHPETGRVVGYRNQSGEIPAAEGYAYFTDVFRGPAERVRGLQRRYLALVAGREPVLDVGCGRGELLDLLRDEGLRYAGVDSDPGMVERCRRAGHADVAVADALEHLDSLADASLGAVLACQVVEHMPPGDLERFLRAARRKLSDDGVLIVETVNPYAVQAFRAFWVDPTHERPLFPETLLAFCRMAGFTSAFVFHPELAYDVEVDRFLAGAYAVVAEAGAASPRPR